MFRPRLAHPQVYEQIFKHTVVKIIWSSIVMTFWTLRIGWIHQVSHEYVFLKIILWNDLEDLQISHTWNFSAGRLLRQWPCPSLAKIVRAQGMNYRGLCKHCHCILSYRKCDKKLSSTVMWFQAPMSFIFHLILSFRKSVFVKYTLSISWTIHDLKL
jgi:hypothetical protein